MTEGPEVPILVHELGGMLSSVQGFAHIAEANPEHPDRERYIKLTASEARRAAQALKDLHLARALDRGAIAAAPPPVEMTDLLVRALDEEPTPGLRLLGSGGLSVHADTPKLARLLGRCLRASQVPPEIRRAAGDPEIVVFLGPAADAALRREALDVPYPDMVLFSLTRRLVERWGGGLTIAAEGEHTVARIRLRRA